MIEAVRHRPPIPAILAIAFVVGGCVFGPVDPSTALVVQNKDPTDYIVAVFEPGMEDVPFHWELRAGETRQHDFGGEWTGTVLLVDRATCQTLDQVGLNKSDTRLVAEGGRFHEPINDLAASDRRADEFIRSSAVCDRPPQPT